MDRKPGIRAFTSASRLTISLLVVCAAAGCAPERGQNVEATGTAAAVARNKRREIAIMMPPHS